MIISRRKYLLYCIGFLGALSPLSACTGKSDSSPNERLLVDLLPLLPNEPLVAEVYLSQDRRHESETFREILDSIDVNDVNYHNSSELLELINQQIQADYRSGDTIDIDGWQLARTELRIITARANINY